jgi:diguanylate cyclase (GGDEF)-like protein
MSAERPQSGDSNRPTSPIGETLRPLVRLDDEHTRVASKIAVVKRRALGRGNQPPAEYADLERYWYHVYRNFLATSKIASELIPEVSIYKRQSFALAEATRDAVNLTRSDEERYTDPLTGAWSRGALDNALDNLRRHGRDNTAVLLLDIDHFKAINDDHGHVYGDLKLKELVQAIQNNIRGVDLVGRYGGEEFGILMPNIPSITVATERAEEIRRKVSEDIGLTVSVGVTIMQPGETDINNVWENADTGLYAAKDLDRNRVCMVTGRTNDGRNIVRDLTSKTSYVETKTENPDGKTSSNYAKILQHG